MNPNITNTTNQTLFSASVTDQTPSRLSVSFHPDSGLSYGGNTGPFQVTDQQECRISLGDQKIEFENAQSLASDCDFGTYFELKKDSQNTGTYECQLNPHTSLTKKDLSHVTLKVRNAKLIVGFRPTPAPTATPANSNSDVFAFLNQPKPVSTTTPPASVVSKWATPAPAKPIVPPPGFNPGAKPAPANSNPWSIWGASLTGCLMNGENFKEDCGLSDIEKGIYKTYCRDSSAKDNDLTKEAYAKLRAKEQAFEALEARKRQADAHRAVDGRLTARAMIEHLAEGDITLYLQVIRLITPNSQNLQAWLAGAPNNNNDYQRLLEAEQAYIRKGN